MTATAPQPEGDDPVDDLLAECLAAADPIVAIERAADGNPALAVELRQRFAFLVRAGALPAGAVEEQLRRLGNFELHERLGGGGMGLVYRATEQPIGRDVALKLIRPEHLWFDGARKRFLREIEAVAALDHPGIVPIYSAGEHEGVPFCAMELVRGQSLADLLAELRDEAGAPDPARLRQPGVTSWTEACFAIGRQIAGALAHGHDRGIVHRDVKPSNIMLGDDGRARLIDFGLARIATADSMTRTGVQPGSLAYMSPEQVRGEDVDARTDVWSLGVTLCELLTLRQPFLAATEAETKQQILGNAAPALSSRGSRLPWDAATVLATAMAPERARRYASMAAFAVDLQAFLEHRPIQARRAGPWLRARRWLQRHPARAGVWFAAAVLFGVLPTVLLLQEHAASGRIEREAQRARVAEAEATQQAVTAQRVVQFLQELFYEAEPERARGNTLTVRVILDRGVQRIRTELQDEPEVRAELLDTMGSAYANLGLIEPARRLIVEGLQLREQQLHQTGEKLRHSRELLAAVANQQGREAEAEGILRELVASLDPTQAALAGYYRIRLAYCAWRLGRLDEAQRGYEEGLGVLRGLLAANNLRLLSAERSYARFLLARVDPVAAYELLTDIAARAATALPVDHPDRLGIESELASAEIEDARPAAAVARLSPAIAIAARVFDANHPTLALLRQQLATALMQLDRCPEGLLVLDQVLVALRATYAAPHFQLATAASLESSLSIEVGDLARAEAAAERAIAMFEQLFPQGHLDFAHVLANLARIETALGHLERAAELATRSVTMHRQMGERRDDAMVMPLAYLASVQALQNEPAEAERNARAALELAATGSPRADRRTLAQAQTYLAEVLLLAGKNAEGASFAEAAMASWEPVSSAGRLRATFVLAWAHNGLGKLEEAERELREVLVGLEPFYAPGHPFYAQVLGELGVVLARRGQLKAAAEPLRRAVEIRRAAAGPDNPLLGLPLLNLGTVLQLQHREVDAVPFAFECLQLVRRHGGSRNRLTASVLLLLARTVPAITDPGQREQQLELVRTAVAELLPPDSPRRAEIEQLLTAEK
jgi:tetratricopeptide (TPR) repeat protein/tRNA A-37 threonylcarbamoyl transferase component Bud32